MKFGYLVSPGAPAGFAAYRALRETVAASGVVLRWIGPARRDALAADPALAAELAHGTALPPRDPSEARIHALETAAAIADERLDGLFLDAAGDPATTVLVPHLPRRLVRIVIVRRLDGRAAATLGALRRFLHGVVATSDLVRHTLVERHGFPAAWTVAIPDAAPTQRATDGADVGEPPLGHGHAFRVLFLGPVNEAEEDVLQLPRILRRMPEGTTLTIAGDGPDMLRLRLAFADLERSVRMLGAMPPEIADRALRAHHALIRPSRRGGAHDALIAAMAAGCVPVAARIDGESDAIVDHGSDGLLYRVGDWRAAATHLLALRRDPARTAALAAAARLKARTVFGPERVTAEYTRLFERLREASPPVAPSLPWRDWSPPGRPMPAGDTTLRPLEPLRMRRRAVCAAADGPSNRSFTIGEETSP
jgi:glycosyltransferase involved in cell wall biosynthesis